MRWPHVSYFALGLLVLLSRLPFLGRGFGVEEDAWGTAVAVRNTLQTGVFETSRLPGHPVNELFYLLLWPADSWWFNFSSALCSVVFALVFFRILIISGTSSVKSFGLSLSCCLVPVVYVSSTCTMDYIWGLMFMSLSWLMILGNKNVWAGVFLGLAIGSRITMAGMFLPFMFLIWEKKKSGFSGIRQFVVASVLTSVFVFLPVVYVYGPGFFTYSDQFPYPPWPKVFYKLSVGVWGIPGLIGIAIWCLGRRLKFFHKPIQVRDVFLGLTLVIYFLVYFVLPQKSAYMIAIVPVVFYYLGSWTDGKRFYAGVFLFVLSSFFLGFNLSDPYRGAEDGKEIYRFSVAGQEVFLDGFGGPITHDYSKRKLKNEYCLAVMKSADDQPGAKSVICGWWYNQILIYSDYYGTPEKTNWIFYADTNLLHERMRLGEAIFFLAEQDKFNDLMFPPSKSLLHQRAELLPSPISNLK